MIIKGNELEDRLREVGSMLLSPPPDVDELLSVLDQTESLLSKVEQSPAPSMSNVLNPLIKSLVAKELLGHSDIDVKVALASCFSEITRITAPEAPYDDDLMKEIFQLIVHAFENLDDMSSRSFLKRVSMLETVANVRSCVLMLDLECDALILEMFHHFLRTIRPNHSEVVFSSMEMIMTLVIEESEDISSELISCLLDSVRNDDKDILPVVRKLGEKIIKNCAAKFIPHFLGLSQSVGSFSNNSSKVVDSVCQESYGGRTQNDTNVSGEIMESAKVEETKLFPEEGTAPEKMLNSVKSNGIGESTLGSSYPEQKPESSAQGDLSKTAAAADKDVSGKVGPKDVQLEAVSVLESCKINADTANDTNSFSAKMKIPIAARQKRGRFNSKLSAAKQSVSPLQEKVSKVVDKSCSPKDIELKESDSEDSANAKQTTAPKDVQLEVVSILKSRKTNADTANDTNLFSDKMKIPIATRQKRGRFSSKLSAAKQSVSPLQEKVSKVVDKSCSPKDIELKESESEDSANVKQTTASKGLVEKSQRRRGRKGSRSMTNDEHTLQKLQRSTIKQHDTLKSQDDTSRESVLKTYGTRTRKKEVGENLVGSKISVWWPMDKKFYNGVVDSYDNISRKHKITYIDGEVERLLLSKERWKLIKDGSKQDTEQIEDSNNHDTSPEEPKRKQAKVTSTSTSKADKEPTAKRPKRKLVKVTLTSTSKETDKEPTTKSGTASGSGHRRRGRPSKAASSNLHDTTSSSSKITERVASKLKDGIAESDTKFKEELVKPKDSSLMDNQCINIPGTEVKDDDSKSGRKSIDDTSKFVGRKVRRDSLKGKPISDSSDSVLKIKGATSPESGIVTKANIASGKGTVKHRGSKKPGKGRVKFRGSEKPRKVRSNISGMPWSDASTGKKRKRKKRT